MNFKKSLASIVSCCYVLPSSGSCCKADFYKYSDLCAIKLTNNKGSNFYGKYKELIPGLSDVVYVSKTLDLPKNDDIVKCGCCGTGVRFSDGYVVGHDWLYSLSFRGDYGELDDDVFKAQDRINDASAKIKKQLKHLVCKKCMIDAISKAPQLEGHFEKDSNKCVQCPCKGCKEKSLQISSLSNLGEPKEPKSPLRKDLEALGFSLIFATIGMIPVVVLLNMDDDQDYSAQGEKTKRYKITITSIDDDDEENPLVSD